MATNSSVPRHPKPINSTIPFDTLNTPSFILKNTIDRSLSRSHWFTAGQRQNPGLGTLSYLPVEIRNRIWMYTLNHNAFCYFNSDIWLHQARGCLYEDYWLPSWKRDYDVRALRAASQKIRLEFDQTFFRATPMEFESIFSATRLMRQIDTWQFQWIRQISFKLVGKDGGPSWTTFFRNHLPPNLQKVCLDLHHEHGQTSLRWYKSVFDGNCGGARCKTSLKPTKTGEKRSCSHLQKLNYLSKRLERDLSMFESVTRTLARNVPQATVQLVKTNADCSLCHESCRALLKDAEELRAEQLLLALNATSLH
ncbi:MAG: hypothetical protein Q9188_007086 [Gyalolechia gomerana]